MIRDTHGTLNADRLDVFFDKETDRIRKIVASGSVRIEREGDVSYSNQAIYDAEVQSVKLVGTPKIEIRNLPYEYLDQMTKGS